MTNQLSNENVYFKSIFDALPYQVFIVDKQVRVIDTNRAGEKMLSLPRANFYRKRGGELIHCVHLLENGAVCGETPFCSDCAISRSVRESLDLHCVVRRKTEMTLMKEDRLERVHLFVTSVPFAKEGRDRALLILEDVTELTKLMELIPICSSCKKIRDDQDYWNAVESYLAKHLNLNFTHSICPECASRLYADPPSP